MGLLLFAVTGESPGHLRDAHSLSPEERPSVTTALRALAEGPALDGLLYVFARGFWPDLRHRWQSADHLLAARGLRKLKDTAGDRFVAGVVLYDGESSVSFGEGLFAVPIR